MRIFLTILYTLNSVLLLTACGFKPMYGAKKGAPEASIAGVEVAQITGERRLTQQLKADLEDRLNPAGAVPAKPTYKLTLNLRSTASPIGVARDGTVSRYNVYLDSDYTLVRLADSKEMTKGSLRHVSSYNNLVNQYYSTYVSEQDALTRGVTELSELYRQRLSPFLAVQ